MTIRCNSGGTKCVHGSMLTQVTASRCSATTFCLPAADHPDACLGAHAPAAFRQRSASQLQCVTEPRKLRRKHNFQVAPPQSPSVIRSFDRDRQRRRDSPSGELGVPSAGAGESPSLPNPRRGRRLASLAPIVVMDAVYQGGSAAPFARMGYGLRADLRVLREKGARTGLGRNVLAINYERVHKPKR